MEQEIRFCELDGRRLAYSTVGEGPLLVFGARWITHLEDEWELPEVRRFYEALARTHRVVRYDRIGVGLSDRDAPPPSIESEARALGAVLDECGDEPPIVFACSCAGLATSRFARDNPERIRKIVYFGGYAARDDIPDATRRSLVDFVRTNWALASQMLAGLFAPHASGDEIAALSAHKRRAAKADVAAAFLELDLTANQRELLPVTTPSLVLHRRGDRAVPIGTAASSPRYSRTRAFCRSAATRTSRGSTTSANSTARSRASSTRPRLPPSTATRRSPRARPRCSASSPPVSRTARSRAHSSSASTPSTGTSRTSCASSRSRHAPPRRLTRRASA